MEKYSSFEIPFEYSDNDGFIRAIRLNMIRKNGEIKTSAFKSNKGGVSVTRYNPDVYEYAIGYMNSHFEGIMATFPCLICNKNNIITVHNPTKGHNLHHWELYGSEQKTALSVEQIIAIINSITIES